MNQLQKCKAHTSLQFGRLRSNRFGENGLTDAYRAVFSKQAAPKSHAFLFCHEPLSPDTRCGELRGGLSSRKPGAAGIGQNTRHRRRMAISSTSRLFSPARDAYGRRRQKAAGLHSWLNGLNVPDC